VKRESDSSSTTRNPSSATGEVCFEGVTKRFEHAVALDDLTLTVRPGELLALVGPSGSGKSTAMRILAGLEQPSAGRVRIGDRDVTDLPPHRRGIAMVFQDYALYPHLNVRQNIAFGLRVRRERDIAQRVDAVARQLHISALLDRHPDQLSGGQQQRVALARAMAREPAVFLLDEPLSSLDTQLRTSARAELSVLHRRLGTTTVYVTHDQAEAMTIGDRIAVIARGRLQQVGTPEEVYDQPANVFVATFLGSPPMNIEPGGGILGGPAGSNVGVRPEDMHVTADGPIEAVVEGAETLGSETILEVRSGEETTLWVRTGPRAGHRPGDRLRLRVDEQRRHLFDPVTGQRR